MKLAVKAAAGVETRDLDENTRLDLDMDGNISGMVMRERTACAQIATSKTGHSGTFRDIGAGARGIWFSMSLGMEAIVRLRASLITGGVTVWW